MIRVVVDGHGVADTDGTLREVTRAPITGIEIAFCSASDRRFAVLVAPIPVPPRVDPALVDAAIVLEQTPTIRDHVVILQGTVYGDTPTASAAAALAVGVFDHGMVSVTPDTFLVVLGGDSYGVALAFVDDDESWAATVSAEPDDQRAR